MGVCPSLTISPHPQTWPFTKIRFSPLVTGKFDCIFECCKRLLESIQLLKFKTLLSAVKHEMEVRALYARIRKQEGPEATDIIVTPTERVMGQVVL